MQKTNLPDVPQEIRALLFYRLMASLWIFPFLGGIAILYPLVRREIEKPNARNNPGVEHWIGLALVLVEPIFLVLAKPWKKIDLKHLQKD